MNDFILRIPPKIRAGFFFAVCGFFELLIFTRSVALVEESVHRLKSWKKSQAVVIQGHTRKITDKYGKTVELYPCTVQIQLDDGTKTTVQEVFTPGPRYGGDVVEVAYDPSKRVLGNYDVYSTEMDDKTGDSSASRSALWIGLGCIGVSAWYFISHFYTLKSRVRAQQSS